MGDMRKIWVGFKKDNAEFDERNSDKKDLGPMLDDLEDALEEYRKSSKKIADLEKKVGTIFTEYGRLVDKIAADAKRGAKTAIDKDFYKAMGDIEATEEKLKKV